MYKFLILTFIEKFLTVSLLYKVKEHEYWKKFSFAALQSDRARV